MPTLELIKVNLRDLTPAEETEIATWWPLNPERSMAELISHFEQKFGTPITKTRVRRIMVAATLALTPDPGPGDR